ncbi:MAG: secretin and TonB N-terminal domain-containing protein, partial [Odoribacter sp.]|nr:secretin and TonB N-terminal domain-containing protein [Odoribacter sp.]
MKLCLILLCAFSFGVSAKTMAQQERVSLQLEKVELKTVLEKIQEQTQVNFMVNREQAATLGLVSVKAKNETIASVLDRLLGNSQLTYVFTDNIIIIKERLKEVAAAVEPVILKGVVRDEKGQPLPGVTVMIKGTGMGVVTNAEGNYTLD